MSSTVLSLLERPSDERPLFTRDQALSLIKQVLSVTTADQTVVRITQTVRSVTQFASGRVRRIDEGDRLEILLMTRAGQQNNVTLNTNQLDDVSLRSFVGQLEVLLKEMWGNEDKIAPEQWDEQDSYPPSTIWHDATLQAMRVARETAAPQILDAGRREGVKMSGFVGLMARASAVMTDKGITAFTEETDCEVSVTARTPDGTSSGWSGVAAREWGKIDPLQVAADAADVARRGRNPRALEPGRRTAILGPGAVVQLMRFLVPHFDGYATEQGNTGFAKVPGWPRGTKIGQRVFDPRITITTNSTDPDGGSPVWFDQGYVDNPTTWIEQGVLKYLGYGRGSLLHGRAYAMMPYALRLHGGETTLEQMIAGCEEGIYVHRVSSLDLLELQSGLMTGTTCDGCFLVKNGKLAYPVKNFRFQTSPFAFFNNLIAIGPTRRTAFGYAPWTPQEKMPVFASGSTEMLEWPRRPMIVPPLMVRDFNFTSLVDAV